MCEEDEAAANAANGTVAGLNFSTPAYSCRHLMKREAPASQAISILNMLRRLSREMGRNRENEKKKKERMHGEVSIELHSEGQSLHLSFL